MKLLRTKHFYVTIVLTFESKFSSGLTVNHSQFQRASKALRHYYYESFELTVSESGDYTFFGESDIDMFGLLYVNQFNPHDSSSKLIRIDDDSGGSYAFRLQVELQKSRLYILVVTTFRVLTPGAFNVIASSSDGEIRFRNGTGPTLIFTKSKQRNS